MRLLLALGDAGSLSRKESKMTTESTVPTFWCANFDNYSALTHGIAINSWLVQYQYEHSGFDYQGNKKQRGMVSRSWKDFSDVRIGDWLVAYLKTSTFFAIGQVRSPRVFDNATMDIHDDTVERTLDTKSHKYLTDIVRYEDAPGYYEDYTDPWRYHIEEPDDGVPPSFLYPQRIDVDTWLHYSEDGVYLEGLGPIVPIHQLREPLFRIPKTYFDDVVDGLREFAPNNAG